MTIHQPRDYQAALEQGIYAAWQRSRNVLGVLPTGGGKTFVFSRIASAMKTHVCASAHRSELVSQMSMAFAREGVRHRVIGPTQLQRTCVQLQEDEFGRSYYDPNARVMVASVDTLIGLDAKTPWLSQVGLWIQDEAHHVLADNKWGAACAMFPNAYGLGVTATPTRADGKGLGRHADGLFDEMVVGPTMRELIDRGYLADYDIAAPLSDIDLSSVPTTDTGDYSPSKLKAARRKSHITGDVVKHYLKLARGKLGITFDTDVESATETAKAYRDAGVPAEVVTAKTPPALRAAIMRRFRAREVLQLVNVDLFGEGTDVPALEVVTFARPTQSYSLYCQQFGRVLRTMPGKERGLIIDHVGNVVRHGLPDAYRDWSLDRRERRSRGVASDVIPLRTCLNEACMAVYERVHRACPFCGQEPPVAARSGPEFVDGDLELLDPTVLARMRGEADRVNLAPSFPPGLSGAANERIRETHWNRMRAQHQLREQIALWAGWQGALGKPQSESYRRFYFTFGRDVMSAQALNEKDAQALTERIQSELQRNGVRRAQP